MSFYNQNELKQLGFAYLGHDVKLSRKASIYGASRISIGDLTRIDDFCVLSAGEGGIDIGRNIHLAVYTLMIGSGRITLADFSNLSSRVSIYSSNDDYSGTRMTNPTVPPEFTGVTHADVSIGRHAIIGSGTIVLPGVSIGDGAAIGALSLVNRDCDSFSVYTGVPARRIKARSTDLLELERAYLDSLNHVGESIG